MKNNSLSAAGAFAKEFGVNFTPPKGKLIEYIFRYIPDHPGIGTIWT